MEARDNYDVVFLIVVLALNGFAFCVILICYAKIYFSLGKETRRGGRCGPKGEMTIAKKMALLVNDPLSSFTSCLFVSRKIFSYYSRYLLTLFAGHLSHFLV